MDSQVRQELSATRIQLQRIATSLDAFEAQTASRSGLTHSLCLEQLQQATQTIVTQQIEMEHLEREIELLQQQNAAQKEMLERLRPRDFLLSRDADVAGYLFSFLPDFSTLISVSLASRFFYSTFDAGRQSITRAVASNQIGRAFPQALRLARSEAAVLLQPEAYDLPREDSALSGTISTREAIILARNAQVVVEFENLFSWKRKDRWSTISVLTEEESLRFQRAMYRVMLLCFAYGTDSISAVDDEDCLDGSQSKQQNFMEEFPTAELYEIQTVALFIQGIGFIRLLEDASIVGSLEAYDFESLVLFAGPHTVLQCYKYHNSVNSLCENLHIEETVTGFIMIPLRRVLSGRDDSRPQDLTRTILDSIHGEDERCSKCNSEFIMSTGVSLVNDTCWDDLNASFQEELQMWINAFRQNHTETNFLETMRNIDYRTFMDTLFDARSGEYSNWMKDEWICRDCLSSLWFDTLPVWWLQRRLQEGIRIKQDCRQGHMCHNQSDLNHARQFNHVCNPAGSDYGRGQPVTCSHDEFVL